MLWRPLAQLVNKANTFSGFYGEKLGYFDKINVFSVAKFVLEVCNSVIST